MTVVEARIGSVPAGAVEMVGWPGQPSSEACGSQSKVSVSPARWTTWVPAGRNARSASSRVDLPTCPASAATISGTRASMRSQRVAASSVSGCRHGSA
jgi:hypothetical protein